MPAVSPWAPLRLRDAGASCCSQCLEGTAPPPTRFPPTHTPEEPFTLRSVAPADGHPPLWDPVGKILL